MEKIKKKLTKKTKIVIIVSVVVAIVAASCGLIAFLNSDSSNSLYNKAALALMPESLEREDLGVVFYVKANPEYVANEKTGELQFICYFMNGNEEVELPGGIFTTVDGEKVAVLVGFMLKAQQKITTIKNIAFGVLAAVALAGIGIAIYYSYRVWSKNQDNVKKELYGDKNNKKTRKPKKNK